MLKRMSLQHPFATPEELAVRNMILENDIELRLVHGIEQLGGLCIKVGQDGWPDRLCVLPGGRVCWVELKRPDGSASGPQRWRAVQLRRLGQRVERPSSAEEVDALLEDLEDPRLGE